MEEYLDTPLDYRMAPYRNLAAAVVRQAFKDLWETREHNSAQIRKGAYIFLVRTIWHHHNLWGQIMGTVIIRKRLLAAVEAKCKLDSEGRVIPIRVNKQEY